MSSPAFYEEFYRQDKSNDKDKKIQLTLAKYHIRSCTRCTPFATFAGCTLAQITPEETSLVVQSPENHKRKIRVDMSYTTQIIQALLAIPEIQSQVPYFPNNSIYAFANVYRYAEYGLAGNARSYHLTAVPKTEYLTAILGEVSNGKTLPQLTTFLAQTAEVTAAEAEEYIQSLCESQILVSDLEAAVTGADPFETLIQKLSQLHNTEAIVAKLTSINVLIQNPESGVAHYQRIQEGLKDLELVAEPPKDTLQVDLFLATHAATIQQSVVEEIIAQTKDLKVLSRKAQNRELDDFKKRFYDKYEEAAVPLAIALDGDLGIGYAGITEDTAGASPLVDGLYLAGRPQNNTSEFDYIKHFTLAKYHDYLKAGKSHIEITEEELKKFSKNIEDLQFPNSQYIFGSLMKEEGKLSASHFQFHLNSFGGPSAGNLLGRFTQGNAALCNFTKDLLAAEEKAHPEAVYAEIVHLPQARIGNILLRPVLRKWEIPYIGKSGADAEHQITVDDLWVKVIGNELVLWSKRLNKRVIPRLTTAHNFSFQSLPVYKFLCDLQSQGIAYPAIWDWGHLDTLKELPRVVYKNIILKKARWHIAEEDLKDLPKEVEAHKAWFQKWCTEKSIPTRIVYAESDNELLLDLEEPVGIELLLHYLRKRKNIVLEEFLFTEENCIVRDAKNRPFTNEIIIPVLTEVVPPVPTQSGAAPLEVHLPPVPNQSGADNEATVKGKFAPFSEWLYFKVYCGNKSAEQLLRSAILEFVEAGLDQNLFERFFFIRYKDDASHIRIRFYNAEVSRQKELFALFNSAMQPYLDNGLVSKVLLDTYSRELERYGGEHIETAERIFGADSLAVLRLLQLLEGTDDQKYRLLLALRGIDQLLTDFSFLPAEKHALAKDIQSSFFKEFGAHAHLQKQLNEKYRGVLKDLFSHMNAQLDAQNEIEEAVAVLNARSSEIKAIINASFAGIEPEARKVLFRQWLPSYIHMFMNRLYIAQQRKYELVVYHFLEKYYASQLALQKHGSVLK